jgi:hypothetical protein
MLFSTAWSKKLNLEICPKPSNPSVIQLKNMQEFLLILKGDGMNHLSPDELQNLLSDYKIWVNSLADKYLGGQKLEDKGAVLVRPGEEIITDGPFLESKEIIAGYFLIQAESQDEANKIASSSPHLGLYSIEVRPISYPKMK